MIAVTANAAASIALRNAIFKIVPFAFITEVYKKCKEIAVGDVKSLSVRRKSAFEYLQKFGTTPECILGVLGKKSIEDVDLEDLARLYGMANSLKSDEANIDTLFPSVESRESAGKVGKVEPGVPEFDDGGTTHTVDEVKAAEDTKPKQKCNLFS